MAIHCDFVYIHHWLPSQMWISCSKLSISIYLHKEIITPQKLWLYIVTLCIFTIGTHLQCEYNVCTLWLCVYSLLAPISNVNTMSVHCDFVYIHYWYPSPMWIQCVYSVTLCIFTIGSHLQCEFHPVHCQLVYIYIFTQRKWEDRHSLTWNV